MIYLDNAATTRLDPEVLDAMMPWLTDKYGNAGAVYAFGNNSKRALDEARETVARFIGASDASQVIFTSGGTESNNAAVRSFREDAGSGAYWASYLTNPTEHHSILENLKRVYPTRKDSVVECKMRPDGKVDIDFIKEYFDSHKDGMCLATIMHMNNETGAENPVAEVGKLMRDELSFHVDCVQSAGCIPINVTDIGCTTASLSSHKIHGPKGVGALYVKEPSFFVPLIYGGSEQESGLRGGTENVAGIVGFAKACEICMREEAIGEYVTELKKLFWDELQKEFDKRGISDRLVENAESAHSHGKTLNCRIKGIDAETMVIVLGAKGVCVSAGSACMSRESVASYVLTSIGLSPDEARESIRISFSKYNTRDEVCDAAVIIAETAKNLYEYTE